MWKKKADKPTLREVQFNFTLYLTVDSALADDELPAVLHKQLKDKINSTTCGITVNRVTRDGEGVIESLRFQFADYDPSYKLGD